MPVTAFFDTSVLVAASVRQHAHYAPAFAALAKVIRGQDKGVLSSHSLAEAYAVLTRLPLQPAIHPSEAHRIIEENFVPHFDIVSLGANECRQVLQYLARQGLGGGLVYDALLLKCAEKKSCDRIYTFNVAHFKRLAPQLEDRISAP